MKNNLGTPNSLIGAIQNALDSESAKLIEGFTNPSRIRTHVRDFIAQIISVEMISAETEEAVLMLKRIMAAVDRNSKVLLIDSRKLNSEIRDAS